ncbi:hypothetical protein [Ruminococcus sp.]
MANKKIYASPEIEVIKFSFENILSETGETGETDDSEYIKESKFEQKAESGVHVGL